MTQLNKTPIEIGILLIKQETILLLTDILNKKRGCKIASKKAREEGGAKAYQEKIDSTKQTLYSGELSVEKASQTTDLSVEGIQNLK